MLLLPLAGIAGVATSVAIYRRPALGAALILLVVNFEGTLELGGVSVVKMLSVLCVGILGVQIVVSGREIKFDLTAWLIVVFLLWVAMTVFWTAERADFSSELISLALQSFMYVLIINLVRSKDDLKLALWGYVIGGTVLAVILSQTMISVNFSRSTTYMEVAGLGLNLAARMVGLNLLMAVLLIGLEKEKSLARLVLIGAAVLSAAGSVLALSRGNWYALLVSVSVLVFVLSVKKGVLSAIKQGVLIAAVGSVALYTAGTYMSDHGLAKLQDRFESAYTFSDRASGRFDIWLTVLDPFLEKPVAGHGFNSFKELNEWKNAGAHNAFVLVAVEDGLVGLVLFLLVLGSVFYLLGRMLLDRRANHMALGWGMALFVFLLTASMVDTSVNRKYLWFVLGIISLLAQFYGRTEEEESEVPDAGHERLAASHGSLVPGHPAVRPYVFAPAPSRLDRIGLLTSWSCRAGLRTSVTEGTEPT